MLRLVNFISMQFVNLYSLLPCKDMAADHMMLDAIGVLWCSKLP